MEKDEAMAYGLCAYALCPMPYALCPCAYALCPRPSSLAPGCLPPSLPCHHLPCRPLYLYSVLLMLRIDSCPHPHASRLTLTLTLPLQTKKR